MTAASHPSASIVDVARDSAIFGSLFNDAESWRAWWTFARALFALPMDEQDMQLYRDCTGRDDAPTEPAREGWLIVGRRGGKSRFLALAACYLAAFCDWSAYLAAGEVGCIVVLAADRRQCRAILNYIRAFLAVDLLKDLVTDDNAEQIVLSNGLLIEVVTASFKTIRSRTVIAALGDECAFWADDNGANPASEVIAALRPAMATIPNALLLIGSSPHAKNGPLYASYKRYFGKPGPILVWNAPSRTMNPALPQSVIDAAMEADEASARAEYGAEFRSDLEQFVSREIVEGLVVEGRIELAPVKDIAYFAYLDPAGGSGKDSMTLSISHLREETVIIDAVRERRPPFSPDGVVEEFTTLLRTYHVSSVTGDRWAGEFVREPFRKKGFTYVLSDRPASDIYRDTLPLLNAGRVELLDDKRLVSQLCNLERRVARSGKDTISHPTNGNDDLCNAVCGSMLGALRSAQREVPICGPIVITSPKESHFGYRATF